MCRLYGYPSVEPGPYSGCSPEPFGRLTELDSTTAAHLFVVAQKILQALEKAKAVAIEGANIFLSDGRIAGQEVPHVHLHVVPRFKGDGITLSFGKSLREEQRGELNRIAKSISAAIRGIG